jgi:hypothetical protein
LASVVADGGADGRLKGLAAGAGPGLPAANAGFAEANLVKMALKTPERLLAVSQLQTQRIACRQDPNLLTPTRQLTWMACDEKHSKYIIRKKERDTSLSPSRIVMRKKLQEITNRKPRSFSA